MEMEEPNLRYAHTIQKLDVNAALLLSIETLYEMAHLVYGEGSSEKIIMKFLVRIPRVRVLRQYDNNFRLYHRVYQPHTLQIQKVAMPTLCLSFR